MEELNTEQSVLYIILLALTIASGKLLKSGEAQEWTLPVTYALALACVLFMLVSMLIANGVRHEA